MISVDLRSQLIHCTAIRLADFTLRLSSRRFHGASTSDNCQPDSEQKKSLENDAFSRD